MATLIVPETQQAEVRQFPPSDEAPDDLEALTPEEEYEAELGEQVMWEEYVADKGVLS